MLGLWDSFIPLLKEADSIVCHRLPSVANALNTMFSFLVCDLKNTVSKATSGPFLDPTQNTKEMVSKLNSMCAHVNSINAKLEQLNRNSQNLQGMNYGMKKLATSEPLALTCIYRKVYGKLSSKK